MAGHTEQDVEETNGHILKIKKLAASQEHAEKIDQLFKKYGTISNDLSHHSKPFTMNLPGFPQAEIIRAGAILITSHVSETNEKEFVVILGTDADSAFGNVQENEETTKISAWSSWFSGQCDATDETFVETIIRECFEESSGLFTLTAQDVARAVESNQFLYCPNDKTLALLTFSEEFSVGAEGRLKLNEARSILNSYDSHYLSVPPAMLEMSEYHCVKMNQFLQVVKRMGDPEIKMKKRNDPVYQVETTTGKILRMDHYYCRTLGVEGAAEKLQEMIAIGLA